MAKIHGDFGDMTRYDLSVTTDLGLQLELDCQDCGSMIKAWPAVTKFDGTVLLDVNLAEINKVAAQHETEEERPDVPPQTRYSD